MLKKTEFDKRLPSKCVQFPFGKKGQANFTTELQHCSQSKHSSPFTMNDMDETSIDLGSTRIVHTKTG